MTMMMEMAGQESLPNPTTPFTTWKLYHNPLYYSSSSSSSQHHLHPPHSARKLAASFRDFIFFQPMDPISTLSIHSQLDLARTQIQELKAEIEFERRMRKKAESSKKRLEREALEEKERRETTERICEVLANEIAADKAEMDRMKKEMEEERKMWRVAEVWREERVRMKLSEARILMEEKVLELSTKEKKGEDMLGIVDFNMGTCGNPRCSNNSRSSSKSGRGCSNNDPVRSKSQRLGSPEAENPHIRRGIKGFVEFPRVVRAVGSRGRQLGSKLECQKAQLRLFLRKKNPVDRFGVGRPDNLNLVVR